MDDIRSFEDLLDLQAEDLKIDRLLARRKGLPELELYRKAHEEAEEAAARLAEAASDLKETTRAFDKSDGELQIVEEKRNAEERRLYAGGLNARETEALMAEVEMLKRKAADMEEAALELMEEREAKATRAAELERRLEEARGAEHRMEAAIKEAWAGIDGEIARHEARKTEIAPLIDPELMGVYEEVRSHKEVAVARLNEGMCGSCQLRLSEAERLTVSRSDPPRCVHCGALLVL